MSYGYIFMARKFWNGTQKSIFCCKDAALQVQMYVCGSVYPWSSWNSTFYSKLLKVSQGYPRLPIVTHGTPWLHKVPPCSKVHELAHSSMSLYAVPFFVWAAHKNFAVLVLTEWMLCNSFGLNLEQMDLKSKTMMEWLQILNYH